MVRKYVCGYPCIFAIAFSITIQLRHSFVHHSKALSGRTLLIMQYLWITIAIGSLPPFHRNNSPSTWRNQWGEYTKMTSWLTLLVGRENALQSDPRCSLASSFLPVSWAQNRHKYCVFRKNQLSSGFLFNANCLALPRVFYRWYRGLSTCQGDRMYKR